MRNNPTLISRLQAQFEAKPELKEKCIATSKAAIKDNIANRAFDEFPVLVADNDCRSLTREYQRLLKEGTKNAVRALEKRLIGIACRELLDGNGKVKQELIAMLDWEACERKMNNYLIVSAFVGMMNIHMTNESSSLLPDNQYGYLAMTKLINNSYGVWIREYMRDNGINYDPKYDDDSFKVEDILSKHPLLVVSIFAGGVVGAGLYGAAKLCQEVYNEYKPLTLPEAPSL